MTERGKKKESRKLNPGLTAWVTRKQTMESTVEKETVIIGDKQAPVTQKQKATDHIDEELICLAIFKT